MKTIKELEQEITMLKKDFNVMESNLSDLVEIYELKAALTQTKAIAEIIKASHFLRGYEIFRGSTRIEEKEIKQLLLIKIYGRKK